MMISSNRLPDDNAGIVLLIFQTAGIINKLVAQLQPEWRITRDTADGRTMSSFCKVMSAANEDSC